MTILDQYGPVGLFFAFVVAHALADFPLQGDYLARVKVRKQAPSAQDWFIALTAHSIIQGGGVWLVTGSAVMGAVEVVLHWLIDFSKGEGRYGPMADQLLHLATKVGYVVYMVYFATSGSA